MEATSDMDDEAQAFLDTAEPTDEEAEEVLPETPDVPELDI
jgi:hypothetical protein